jgi:spore maturation protein SpmB
MILFLAINTSSITVLPTTVIALRAAAGSADPAGIVPPTLAATLAATAVAIISAKLLGRFGSKTAGGQGIQSGTIEQAPSVDATEVPPLRPLPLWTTLAAFAVLVAVIPATLVTGKALSAWLLPAAAVLFLGFGIVRHVRVYEAFVEGAKEGFEVAVRIIPYLVAILVAIGMARASGAVELLIGPLGRVTVHLGLPPEALTMAVLRSFSGSGAYGYLASLIQDPSIGPDSHLGYLVSTIQGSSETTFYVLAVYFGAIGIRRIRHALAVGIIGDVAGAVFSVIACWLLLPI